MKGCFIYCTDKALANYLKEKIDENKKKVSEFYSSIVANPEPYY